MSDILADIPPETQQAFQSYLMKAPETKAEIYEDLHGYLQAIALVANDNALFDVELAQLLGKALKQLLDRCDDDNLGIVHAAARYFMEDQDASSDLSASLGFEDDAKVFNCVCDYLGHSDLKVKI